MTCSFFFPIGKRTAQNTRNKIRILQLSVSISQLMSVECKTRTSDTDARTLHAPSNLHSSRPALHVHMVYLLQRDLDISRHVHPTLSSSNHRPMPYTTRHSTSCVETCWPHQQRAVIWSEVVRRTWRSNGVLHSPNSKCSWNPSWPIIPALTFNFGQIWRYVVAHCS